MATTPATLPPGWRRHEWTERREALSLLPHRVLVQYAAEAARKVLPVYESRGKSDAPRNAILAAEAWAAEPTDANRNRARETRENAWDAAATAATAAAYAAAATAAYAAAATAATAYSAAAAYAAAAAVNGDIWPWLYAVYCHARGPLVTCESWESDCDITTPVTWSPSWSTSAVVGIARTIRDTREFSRFPILADALEDAWCEVPAILDHLRGCDPEERTCADWCIWNPLGYGGGA